jgi:hypothetical protein
MAHSEPIEWEPDTSVQAEVDDESGETFQWRTLGDLVLQGPPGESVQEEWTRSEANQTIYNRGLKRWNNMILKARERRLTAQSQATAKTSAPKPKKVTPKQAVTGADDGESHQTRTKSAQPAPTPQSLSATSARSAPPRKAKSKVLCSISCYSPR